MQPDYRPSEEQLHSAAAALVASSRIPGWTAGCSSSTRTPSTCFGWAPADGERPGLERAWAPVPRGDDQELEARRHAGTSSTGSTTVSIASRSTHAHVSSPCPPRRATPSSGCVRRCSTSSGASTSRPRLEAIGKAERATRRASSLTLSCNPGSARLGITPAESRTHRRAGGSGERAWPTVGLLRPAACFLAFAGSVCFGRFVPGCEPSAAGLDGEEA